MAVTATIPLIIRGEVIEADLLDYGAFSTPPIEPYIDRLILRDPLDLRDLHALSTCEVIDYLVELGHHLRLQSNCHLRQALERTATGPIYTRPMAEAIYENLPRLLSRPHLEEYVEANLGSRYLDGWVETRLHDRRTAVRAFGARAVHVIAGNGPAVSLMTVIANAIARSDAIIKLPSHEPGAATAIVRTMIDVAPDHPITRHVSVAYWKGGDRTIEKRLYNSRNIEKIVAWGGFASMRSIREHLEPGIDLIALDPKLSASIIGRTAFDSDTTMAEAAARAAFDIGHYNQAGCVNARVLYIESGTDPAGVALANRFGEMVYREIQDLPADASSPHPSFDPVLREELDGIRHSADFRMFGGRGNEGAVIVSQAEEIVDFSERLDCRVANIVPVDRAEDALRYLTVDTQTIGIYPEELKHRLRDECALRGGQRVISLGFATAAGASMTGPHDALQLLGRMVRWLRDDTLEHTAGVVHATSH
jgi:hypothetical protein